MSKSVGKSVVRVDVRAASRAPTMPPAQNAHMSTVKVNESTVGSQPNSCERGAEKTDHP